MRLVGIACAQNLNLTDGRQRRSLMAGGAHCIDSLGIALEQGLNTAVGTVTHPPVKLMGARRRLCPGTKPNPLHPAVNADLGQHQAGLFKLENGLVNSQTIARARMDRGNYTIAFGAHHVFHLHRLNHCQLLAGFDRFTNRNSYR